MQLPMRCLPRVFCETRFNSIVPRVRPPNAGSIALNDVPFGDWFQCLRNSLFLFGSVITPIPYALPLFPSLPTYVHRRSFHITLKASNNTFFLRRNPDCSDSPSHTKSSKRRRELTYVVFHATLWQ